MNVTAVVNLSGTVVRRHMGRNPDRILFSRHWRPRKLVLSPGSANHDGERDEYPVPGTPPNGLNGKDRRYYEWDHTHGDMEVYDSRGNHLGTMDPQTGQMTKPAAPGRKIAL
jgi:hypothetical protein